MLKLRIWTAIAVTSLVVITTMPAISAVKPRPKPKPTQRVILGTTQLAGDTGEMGKTYTLGKETPWNITMNSAEYVVGHLRIGENVYTPDDTQKMLVMHYTVHNPNKAEALMRYDTFGITAVDPKNTNWESIGDIGAKDSGESVSVSMKPAQKMEVCTAIMVPAAGPVSKVIFKSSDQLVVRYYPDQIVKGVNIFPVTHLDAPYKDPADPTGVTALAKVPATTGVYYPYSEFDLKVDSAALSTKPIKDVEVEEGQKFLIVNLTAKNILKREGLLRFDTFQPKLTDGDGIELEWGGDTLAPSRDVSIDTNLAIDQEMKFRYYFKVPSDATLGNLTITRNDSRTFVYDTSSVK
jgi:hypothetical protein